MSDNNDDSNDKHDLTRIEDLSEFLHSEDDDDLSDLATDPDIQIPDGFSNQGNQEESTPDFDALENDSFNDFQNSEIDDEDIPDLPNDVQEENTTSFDSPSEFDNNFDSDFGNNDDSLNNSFSSNEFSNDENSFEENDTFSTMDSFETNENDFSDGQNSFDQNENTFDSENSFESGDDIFENNDFQNDSVEEDFVQVVDDQILDEQTLEGSEILNEIVDSSGQDTQSQEETSAQQDSFEEPIKEDSTQKHQEVETNFNEENKTKLPQYEKEDEFKAPENFKQLQQFAKNISYGNMAKEGNPPFSIILKDIKYEEDVEDILILLKEFKIITEDDEQTTKNSLERGSLLIPRLGEFSAITICHKLRRFDINILMGLTEEINPPKAYDSDDRGLATKDNVYNNRSHNWNFDNNDITVQNIITATTPTLEGHEISDYINVATEYIIVDMDNFIQDKSKQEKILSHEISSTASDTSNKDFFSANINLLNNTETLSINDIYKSLIEKIKTQAIDNKGNAIVGINFQVTPLIIDDSLSLKSRYQITCSGSIVWANKK